MATRDDVTRLLERLEQISADHKQQMEALREQLLERIRDLEESIERPKPEPPKDPKDEVVPGFVPHSARKRNYELAHRKREK